MSKEGKPTVEQNITDTVAEIDKYEKFIKDPVWGEIQKSAETAALQNSSLQVAETLDGLILQNNLVVRTALLQQFAGLPEAQLINLKETLERYKNAKDKESES